MRINEIKRELIKSSSNFFKKIDGKIAIIYGHDCDSIASACVMFKLAEKLNLKPNLIVSRYNFEVDNSTLKKCEKYENIIIVDIGDTPEERLNSFSINRNLLLIDHHMPKKYNFDYVNPRIFRKEIYMPVSYICWLIYRNFFDDRDILWISGFGTLGDFGAKENKDLFMKIRKVDRKLIENYEIDDKVLIEKSLLGKITKMVDSCRIFGGIKGVKYVSNLIANSKSYYEVLKNRKINKYYNKLETEMKKEIENLKKNAIIIGKFLIYELKTKYNLKSSLASLLPRIYKDKIIFVAQKNQEGFYEISVRRGTKLKVDLSKLVNKICKMTSAKGGGHPTAAGMRIDRLEELIDFIKKQKGKKGLLG